ncbi:hypothetical protein COL52_03115 [Bacillus toyonensis]|uniref:Uncharacterized protein n=1 Tax=Bacillus toyonensis TaxID=155322 RepID=A0A2B7VZP2_9BACI|nr:hypothetical protein CN688_11380 [Bacillus toyonensis]PFY64932.1 hypothetical protein COL52_03115 [Bacillus toyonensis]PGG89744.1 hypothetical protein CON73_17490 [Bacillus toyonensis]
MPTPAEFPNTRAKEWRFFEWGSQKIRLDPCIGESPLRDIESTSLKTLIYKGFLVIYVQP